MTMRAKPSVKAGAAPRLKPRNPVQAALRQRAAGAGTHQKAQGALRRAGRMALARGLADGA
jgi:hypothetical protein